MMQESTAGKHTYGQILKSSAMIGGSSVVSIAIGIIRTKAMAVLLGPAGVGLLGLYGSIADLAASVAGMGVNSSGVRQVAEAAGSGDRGRIARTAIVLRRTSLALGLISIVLLVALSEPIAVLTFGGNQHAAGVALLSLAVFFRLMSEGRAALLQGTRRIADLAKMGVLGAFFGTLISIPLVYFFREDGVVPSLVLGAAMTLVTALWYASKVEIQATSMTASQVGKELSALLKLGSAFMASGVMMMGVAYAIRIFVTREVGIDAAGLYQCAWAVGGLYVGLILQSMGADFYPRLTAVAQDDTECNRVVNEQAQVSLLLAAPGVLATLTFAPLVISLLYTAQFAEAVPLLRWLCLGVALRVISWPMGYIIIAKGNQRLFFLSEAAWTVVHVGLAWICVRSFGLNGAGMAFFGSYVFHVFMIYAIVRRLSGFRWSMENAKTGLSSLLLVGLVFWGFSALSPLLATVLGAVAVASTSVYSLRALLGLGSLDRIPRPLLRLLVCCRLATPSAK
ncbi:MAG: O-antigen translocase [Burkholderiales bacterium]